MKRRHIVLVTIGAALALLVPVGVALPKANTPRVQDWNDLFMEIFWIALVVGVLVNALIIYALIRFRAKKGGPKEGPHIHGNTRMEIAWTIAPAVVMGYLLVLSFNGLFQIEEHADDPTDFVVRVTASRFSWEFQYPTAANPMDPNGEIIRNGTLRVEQNRVVELKITATDVIHAFSLPELNVMKDAVPGRVNYDWFKATIPGNFTIKCRELCGVGHSKMLAQVIVFPEGSERDPNTGEVLRWGWAPKATPPTPTTTPTPTNTTATTPPPPEGKVIPVRLAPGGAFTIDPKEIKDIKVGEPVTFDVVNADATNTHNLLIGEFDTAKAKHGANWDVGAENPLGAGQTGRVTVTFEKDATYEYWCDIPGHRFGQNQGMSGILVVGAGGQLAAEKEPLLPGFELGFLALGVVAVVFVLRRRV